MFPFWIARTATVTITRAKQGSRPHFLSTILNPRNDTGHCISRSILLVVHENLLAPALFPTITVTRFLPQKVTLTHVLGRFSSETKGTAPQLKIVVDDSDIIYLHLVFTQFRFVTNCTHLLPVRNASPGLSAVTSSPHATGNAGNTGFPTTLSSLRKHGSWAEIISTKELHETHRTRYDTTVRVQYIRHERRQSPTQQ